MNTLDKIIADLDRHNNPSKYEAPRGAVVRDTARLAFWRSLNARLADFGRPPANFGEAHAAYGSALTSAALSVIASEPAPMAMAPAAPPVQITSLQPAASESISLKSIEHLRGHFARLMRVVRRETRPRSPERVALIREMRSVVTLAARAYPLSQKAMTHGSKVHEGRDCGPEEGKREGGRGDQERAGNRRGGERAEGRSALGVG